MTGGTDASSSLRVALVTQHFDSQGGVRTLARWLHDGLVAAGYDVDVHNLATAAHDPQSRQLTRPRTWLARTLKASGDEPHVLRWGANGSEVEPLRYLPRAELTAALADYDVVQVVSGAPALALATSRCGRPVVLLIATRVSWERAIDATGHGWRHLARKGMVPIIAAFEPRALRGVQRVMVLNDTLGDYVRSVGQPEVSVAPPGVDTAAFAPAAPGWRADGYVLSVCRLADPRKRLGLMVRAYARLRAERPRAPTLVLAGHGDVGDDLRSLVEELGLAGAVEVRSDVPLDDLPALYRGASLFWQTSSEEGLGISSIEAQSCGIPVVATDTAGARRAVQDGVTGTLVPLGTDEDVITAMVRASVTLLEESGADTARRARARAVEEFSTAACLRPFLTAYRELVGREPSE